MTSADFSQQTFFDRASYFLFQHVCETSRGKADNFHSMHPHHLHFAVRAVFGLCFVWQAHPNGCA
jgi:hypothetical protein